MSHRPGVKNQNADGLSWMEDLPEVPEDHDIEEEWDRQDELYIKQKAVGLSLL